MASLYTRPRSPYFWIKFRSMGRIKQISTNLKTDVAVEIRKAKTMEAEFTLRERQEEGDGRAARGWDWAADFLAARYASSPVTLERYKNCWQTLLVFLQQMEIVSPLTLTRKHCFDYIAWRKQPNRKAKGVYAACRNTALLELKILRVLMQEAVERGLVIGNPCVKLGLKRDRPKEKPELSEDDCATIRTEIPKVEDPAVREMLNCSFEIALHQGCRLAETRLDPRSDVDLRSGTIRFRNAKGGKDFITMLHPQLRPLFENLRRQRKTSTWSIPQGRGRQWASANWWKFLERIGLKDHGITFHSTRVTVVTQLARGNVHESKAQAFVGHASTVVHRIYQRLRPADLSACVEAVAVHPSSSSPGSPSGT